MANARKATVSVSYNGKNIDTKLTEYLSSFSYSDEASGQGDDISITINDRDKKWIKSWFPSKGDTISATIQLENWTKAGDTRKLSCGNFVIDDFSFSGSPIRLKLNAIATPVNSSFKDRTRTKTWEHTNLENIAESIAKRYGMKLYYEASKVEIGKTEQSESDDCSFLNELVVRYGYAMKIYKNKIVIFNEETYEKRKAVATITEQNIEPNWSWDTRIGKTYTGAKYEYTDNDTNQTYSVSVGGGDRILKVSEATSSLSEARRVAIASINEANKSDTTMSVVLALANPKIIATSCVTVSGLGKLDGKYYVENVSWEVSSGVKQKLSLRKVKDRFTTCNGLSSDVAKEVKESNTIIETTKKKTQISEELVKGGTYVLETTKKGYYTAAEALAGQATGGHPTTTRRAGTYTIFSISQGMLNLTNKEGTPGSWINPD